MATMATPTRTITADLLTCNVYSNRDDMGKAAATYVVSRLAEMLRMKDEVRIVVGSAPSQDEFFDHLTSPENRQKVDWSRIVVFHMDEYIGLADDDSRNFRAYQYSHLLSRVQPKQFHAIRGEASDIDAECQRLTELLSESPIDLVCLGIGENGHLAFNDPPASPDETEWVKIVELDQVCRQQQVNDGCFDRIEEVPLQAITLSLRVFKTATVLSGVVPSSSKAGAVQATLEGPVTEMCPATMMRRHPDATLFVDEDAASKLTVQ